MLHKLKGGVLRLGLNHWESSYYGDGYYTIEQTREGYELRRHQQPEHLGLFRTLAHAVAALEENEER